MRKKLTARKPRRWWVVVDRDGLPQQVHTGRDWARHVCTRPQDFGMDVRFGPYRVVRVEEVLPKKRKR